MGKMNKLSKTVLDFTDAVSTQETLAKILFSLSLNIQSFLTANPSLINIFYSVGVFLIFWRKRSKTVTERLLGLIDDSLDNTEIKKLAQSKNFQIIFPQIFEALIKEVSEEKTNLIYKFTKNFIKNTDSNTKYLTKVMILLAQMTPEEEVVASIIYNTFQKEGIDKNLDDKILVEIEKEIWSVLQSKYSDETSRSAIDSLFNYGIIGKGRISYDGQSSIKNITGFGKYFIKMIEN